MLNIPLQNKTVFIRVDFNVPMDDGKITDDTRIQNALPTLTSALERGAKVILASHLGRPQKDKNKDGSIKRVKYSLSPVASYLDGLLADYKVHFVDETVGSAVKHAIDALSPGQVLLLENTRFHTEEKKSDAKFARELADLADYYINDAFGTAHRDHATTAGMARYFSSDHKFFGLLMNKELEQADRLLHRAEPPFVAILGGAKVSDKIQLIDELLDRVQYVVIGGGMAFTFVKAQGGQIGQSLVEADKIELAGQLLQKAREKGVEMILPTDAACATAFENVDSPAVCPIDAIPADMMGLDIGPDSIAEFRDIILKGKTIFWNGPMGVFEFSNFAKGSFAVADAIADATDEGAYSLIGGGDSVAAIEQSGHADRVSFISTGGGAMLTLLEGGVMPAIDAMRGVQR